MQDRLKEIASLVKKDAAVVDIGTDHAYLPIYLYNEGITKNIVASDKSEKVLEKSLANLEKNNLADKIPLVLSDGFENIDKKFDVAIIAGMGTNTIKGILESPKIPDTLIIESNCDHYELRTFMQDLGYKIDKEVVIKDNGIYYVIIRYIKGHDELSYTELLFGKSNNLEYFKYLNELYRDLYLKSQDDKYLEYVHRLDAIIEKIQD